MQADPIGEVRGLYEWLGEPVTARVRVADASWWTHDRRQARAEHALRPGRTFGLDLDEVRPLFAEIRRRDPSSGLPIER